MHAFLHVAPLLHEIYSVSIHHNRSISKFSLTSSTIWYFVPTILSNLLWLAMLCRVCTCRATATVYNYQSDNTFLGIWVLCSHTAVTISNGNGPWMSINLSPACIIKSADLILLWNILKVIPLLSDFQSGCLDWGNSSCVSTSLAFYLEHSVYPHTYLALSCWITDGRQHAFGCVCHMKLC